MLFADVAYRIFGFTKLEMEYIEKGLQLHGGRKSLKDSDTTHVITKPEHYAKYQNAKVAVVVAEWVFRSILLGKKCSEIGFYANPSLMFSNMVICLSELDSAPKRVSTALVEYYGGRVGDTTEGCTHLLVKTENSSDWMESKSNWKGELRYTANMDLEQFAIYYCKVGAYDVVTYDWFLDTIRKRVIMPLNPYRMVPKAKAVLELEMEIKDRHDNLKKLKLAKLKNGVMGNHQLMMKNLLVKLKSSKHVFYGKTFVIDTEFHEELKIPLIECITRGGGKIANQQDKKQIAVCMYCNSDFFKKARHFGSATVSVFWIYDCITEKLLLPVGSSKTQDSLQEMLHWPLIAIGVKQDLQHMVVATTGIRASSTPSSSHIQIAIQLMGACWMPVLSRVHTTHLICGVSCATGEKYQKAKFWNIELVEAQWVVQQFQQWKASAEVQAIPPKTPGFEHAPKSIGSHKTPLSLFKAFHSSEPKNAQTLASPIPIHFSQEAGMEQTLKKSQHAPISPSNELEKTYVFNEQETVELANHDVCTNMQETIILPSTKHALSPSDPLSPSATPIKVLDKNVQISTCDIQEPSIKSESDIYPLKDAKSNEKDVVVDPQRLDDVVQKQPSTGNESELLNSTSENQPSLTHPTSSTLEDVPCSPVIVEKKHNLTLMEDVPMVSSDLTDSTNVDDQQKSCNFQSSTPDAVQTESKEPPSNENDEYSDTMAVVHDAAMYEHHIVSEVELPYTTANNNVEPSAALKDHDEKNNVVKTMNNSDMKQMALPLVEDASKIILQESQDNACIAREELHNDLNQNELHPSGFMRSRSIQDEHDKSKVVLDEAVGEVSRVSESLLSDEQEYNSKIVLTELTMCDDWNDSKSGTSSEHPSNLNIVENLQHENTKDEQVQCATENSTNNLDMEKLHEVHNSMEDMDCTVSKSSGSISQSSSNHQITSRNINSTRDDGTRVLKIPEQSENSQPKQADNSNLKEAENVNPQVKQEICLKELEDFQSKPSPIGITEDDGTIDTKTSLDIDTTCIKQYRFLLGGEHDQKQDFASLILQLGGTVCDLGHVYDPSCTHVVLQELRRTEKFVAGCAAGKWILKDNYLTECSKANKFLNEKDFLWGSTAETTSTRRTKSRKRKSTGNIDARIWPPCATYWQQQIRNAKNAPTSYPFYGWQVILHKDCVPPVSMCSAIIQAGGGMVIPATKKYTIVNNIFCIALVNANDPPSNTWVDAKNIPVLDGRFLIEYITKDQTNGTVKFEEYVIKNTNDAPKATKRRTRRKKTG